MESLSNFGLNWMILVKKLVSWLKSNYYGTELKMKWYFVYAWVSLWALHDWVSENAITILLVVI